MNKLDIILNEVFDIIPGSLSNDFNFRDLQTWDSMAYMILVTRVEEDFGFELSSDEIVKLLSIGQIELVLKDHGII